MKCLLNDYKCLLLNVDYSPLCLSHWHKSIVWHLKNSNNQNYSIQIIKFYENAYIHTINKIYPIPAVAITKKYQKNKYNQPINFSRKNVYIRDKYMCQYCGISPIRSHLTYDHIIPKSRFDNKKEATNWKNVVTCCIRCNHKKGDKTPKEAGMTLLKEPICPKYSNEYLTDLHDLLTMSKDSPSLKAWSPFLEK
jgi:5-methylcytosine-specific restriction endonuclease McrA